MGQHIGIEATVRGIVQGVGFRPFVHRLARRFGVRGFVNNFTGGVRIAAAQSPAKLAAFLKALASEAPPMARIEAIEIRPASPENLPEGFQIIPSRTESGPIFIPPDAAICRDCRAELFDPSNPRFLHPFINCTNCGPRYTIIISLPYDRPRTAMAGFEMCRYCRGEDDNIDNRRYHAQPVCCPDCGPRVWLADPEGRELASDLAAIALARRALADGAIVAVKGLGGFHLACDATQDGAVRELRRRKRRWEKPLAVMAPSVEAVRRLVELDEAAERVLRSPAAPIVLARKRRPEPLAPSVAPDSPDYGVMLPYTPLHLLLLHDVPMDRAAAREAARAAAEAGRPGAAAWRPAEAFLALVMTSGNLSEEPICTENEEALERLGGIADLFLLHDRPIFIGCDDSVARAWADPAGAGQGDSGAIDEAIEQAVWAIADTGGAAMSQLRPKGGESGHAEIGATIRLPDRRSAGVIYIRRSRGYAPEPIRLPVDAPAILATGGHLKNTICLAAGRLAYPSQHIGDLENYDSLAYLKRTASHLRRLLQIEPEIVAYDLHPGYLSTRYARELAREVGAELRPVQHHHAHMAACLAENGLTGPAVGIICDGTGYGLDGTVWGFEVLVGGLEGFARAGHLREIRLAGGEAAVREPWRAAAAWLMEAFGPDLSGWPEPARELLRRAGEERGLAVVEMMRRGLNSPYASSAGRLFDAAAALLGLRLRSAYEGQAAMMLEGLAAAHRGAAPRLRWAVEEGPEGFVLDARPLFEDLCWHLQRGAGAAELAAAFHMAFVDMCAEAARMCAAEHGLRRAAISGGTFQNRLLLEGLVAELREAGLEPIVHRRVPPNDGGLSLGQVAAAAAGGWIGAGAEHGAEAQRGAGEVRGA